MPSCYERIERKHRLLERHDPEYASKLDRAFTGHLATAIRASSPAERKRALEEAAEAYEGALDDALRRSARAHVCPPECAG
jgi:hypothetical protein